MALLVLILVIPGTLGYVCDNLLDHSKILSTTSSQQCSDIGQLRPSDPTTIPTCFITGNASKNWISVKTSVPFILRKIEIPGSSEIRLSSTIGGTDVTWFRTTGDRDDHAQWSVLLADNGVITIPDGLEFTNTTVWIKSDVTAKLKTGVKLFGCWKDDTRSIEYVFNSTVSAVKDVFSSLQFFESEVAKIVKTKVPSDRFITHALDKGDGKIGIKITVLPQPGGDSSVSVDVIADMISSDNHIIKSLQAIQGWVYNDDTHLCLNKQCLAGSVCLNGQCTDKD